MSRYRYFSDGPRVMVDDEGDVKYVLTVDYYGPEPSARSAKWVAEELNKVVCLNGAMTPATSSNPPAPDDAARVRERCAVACDALSCYSAQTRPDCARGFCGHARCGHIQECAAAIRALPLASDKAGGADEKGGKS